MKVTSPNENSRNRCNPLWKLVIAHLLKKEQLVKEPKKRGRKKKEEREQWLLEKAEEEADLPLYEKTIAHQLTVSVQNSDLL